MNAPGPLPFPADGHAPAGHRLGHFELRGVASRNPLGIVYRAWDHELGIAVAIKEYLPDHLARRDAHGHLQPQGSVAIGAFERGRDAFIDETRLLARCDHPSLLRVRQLLRAHGTVYRVMPWCQGWPLAELRREMADPPDEPALRRLLDDVLGALEAWHRVGGPHRSVNPAKVLLLDDDRALLLGPSLARRAMGDDAGTPPTPLSRSFLAPEQRAPAAQSPCAPCTDFFALAQVVRYCITGMLPQPDAPAAQPLATLVEALYFDAPRVRYDDHFLRAIDAAASPAMADRPQTATEFRDWLDHGPRRAPAVPAAAAPETTLAEINLAAAEAEHVDIPVEAPAPSADETAAGAPAKPGYAAASPEEAVDEATVDLIRRVIEAIPERQEPPQPPQGAVEHPEFAESFLRVEDWADTPPAAPQPARRQGGGLRWLVGAVALATAAYAAWAWGWPAWQQGMAATEASARSTASLQPAPTPAVSPVAALATPPASAAASSPAPEAADSATSAEPEEAAEPEAAPSSPAGQATATPTSAVATVVVSQAPPTPAAQKTAEPPAPTAKRSGNSPDSPRQACGTRTQFALYRCMQQQCASAAWARHEQCAAFKATDRVE